MHKLYVKTHNKTGLKYLGKTVREDVNVYRGSGTYWERHLNKHGNDVTTEIIGEYETKDELKQAGIHYSELWDVIKSSGWANLKREEGDGGAYIHSSATRERHRLAALGHTVSEETKEKIRQRHLGGRHTEEHKRKIREGGKGLKRSTATRLKMKQPKSPEHKEAMRLAGIEKWKCRI